MVKLDMAKQTEFPPEVTNSITFCENSKSDVTAIMKSVEQMISNFKAIGMTPAYALADNCINLAAKTKNRKVENVMREIHSVLNDIAKCELKTAERVELKFFESWSQIWLKQNLKIYLNDINELKKRRLDKDGLAYAADKHPDDENKQQKSKEANERYNEQLTKVINNIKEFPAHYQRTAEAIQELMNIMAEHYENCANITHKSLKHVRK